MGLFNRKQNKEEPKEREPVKELDKSYYVKTSPAAKTANKDKPKVKKTATEKKPAEKKEVAKPAAEKKAAAKPAAKKTAAKPVAEKKTAAKPAEKKPAATKPAAEKKTAAKPAAEKKAAAPKKDSKTYLISPNSEKNKWQVKAHGAERVLKYFNTKKEAEEYVKGLQANNSNAKVHKQKKDGTFQKKK